MYSPNRFIWMWVRNTFLFLLCLIIYLKQWTTSLSFYSDKSREKHFTKQPHILFVLADDYGWNDIGKDFVYD